MNQENSAAIVSIILPDLSEKQFNHEPTILEVAESIGPRLAKETLAGRINGQAELLDLRTQLKHQTKLEIITSKSAQANEVIRHSAAHVLAQAVQELYPGTQVTIGPVIEDGFYYDFASPHTFSEEDLQKIENKMLEIIRADLNLVREVWDAPKAIEVFKNLKEHFKVEIITGLNTPEVSIYRQGNWFDLCRGPHVQRTGQIKAIKLLSVAGAYWRGDEKNPMLQRIYGTAFSDKKDLEDHLYRLEEAKKRDHRKLGKELGLFMFHEYAQGAPFFTGKGAVIYNSLTQFIRELYLEYGYQEVITPQIFDIEMFKQSGHYANYRDSMYFFSFDERQFAPKPMNCPSHCLLFASEKRSYRDLPMRMADFGRLHRHEKSGALHGLTRVTTFCQDDAHIFCELSDLQKEIASFLSLLSRVYKTLGLNEYEILLSTRPEKRMGSDEIWDQAEGALASALNASGTPFTLNPGDGAFYGPKLDIMFVDALKRPWQLGTIQCDFNLPEAFRLNYVGRDNSDKHTPVLLHRAILGSLERFMGVYLEHTAGHLPAWLSPEQVRILNVTDRVNEYCQNLERDLKKRGVRAHFDDRSEKLSYKIRGAQNQKIPYMLIVGDQEALNQQLTLRFRDGESRSNLNRDFVIEEILLDIRERNLESRFKKQSSGK